MKFGSYLVCKEYLHEVKDFLNKFLYLKEDRYTSDEWVTFEVPETSFLVNLMKGDSQELTQNFTIEIYFDSLEKLADFADQQGLLIKSFEGVRSKVKYVYHYVEILGPNNVCKIEANYIQEM